MIKIIIKYWSLNFCLRSQELLKIAIDPNSLNKRPAICNSFFVFSIIYLYFSGKIYSRIKYTYNVDKPRKQCRNEQQLCYCLPNDYLRYCIYDFRRCSRLSPGRVPRNRPHCLKHAACQNNFPRVIHSLFQAWNTWFLVANVKSVYEKFLVLQHINIEHRLQIFEIIPFLFLFLASSFNNCIIFLDNFITHQK